MTQQYLDPMNQQEIPPQLPQKKFYQKSWFIVLLLILFWPVGLFLMWKYADWSKVAKIIITAIIGILFIFGIASGSGGDSNDTATIETEPPTTTEATTEATTEVTTEATTKSTTKAPETTAPTKADPTANYTMEERNCYNSAKNYLNFMGFSKQGLIDQLSSEYGDNYPRETAEKVVNDMDEAGEVDWVEEAKESAKSYLDTMSFSKQELIEQLCSEYGDNYTREQAEKAVDAVYQ